MARRMLMFAMLASCEGFALQSRFMTPLRAPVRERAPPPAAVEVMDPSYSLAIGSVALGAAFGLPPREVDGPIAVLFSRLAYALGTLLTIFGAFIAFQTTTLRFTFDDTNFALVKADLTSTGENVVVGGENVWARWPISIL